MAENKPTPQQHEAAKTESERAQDIAYTINHALACTATDFIDPYFGNLTQKYLGRRVSIGCGHDHSHDDAPCEHDHGHLKHWWIGEVIGDFGAVPVTIAAQRYLPGFMNGLRNIMEPLLGGFFRKGAERSARKWATEQGIDTASQDYKDRVEFIYRHEVDHLPQALMWTVSSIAINLATQRAVGNRGPFWQLAAGKAVGASISAGLVVGGRGAAPGAAEKWDNFTSEHLFLPATKTLGKLFGVKKEDVDRMAETQKEITGESWADHALIPSPSGRGLG